MLLPALAVAVGFATGLATGGRLRVLGDLRFRRNGVLAAALGMQFVLGWIPDAVRTPAMLASYGAAGAWIAWNCRGRPRPLVAAFGLLVAGWALNLAVIAANGGMPVSRHALDVAGASQSFDVRESNLYKHVPADTDTLLRPLGDVLPVPPLRTVVSVGDILLFVGTASALAVAMHRRAGAGLRSTPAVVA
jgi:hypothetical protein